MKICFMCDLHLPEEKTALQYSVMEWAISDVLKKQPDAVLFAGDITANGEESAYRLWIEKMKETNIPFLYIPGNSDLRNPSTMQEICENASACKTDFADISVYAVNDSDFTVSDEQLKLLWEADKNSIVFMHHPIYSHQAETAEKLTAWREAHPDIKLFYGHLHRSFSEGNDISLQAMDPDKATGENPCITYFDTETEEIRKAYFFCPVPADLYGYFGISCYDTIKQIDFAIKENLTCLELRPESLGIPIEKLEDAIESWRKAVGRNLSLHMPANIGVYNGKITGAEQYPALMELVERLKVDRIIQHVPAMSVKEIRDNPEILDAICEFIAEQTESVQHDLIIAVENMHMEENELPDETRRFGYIPEECLLFVEKLLAKCKHKVGINFDIGHARNNAPFSQKYPISSWFAKLGKHIVSYHMHQVTYGGNEFQNHTPITNVYGHLISYASFFRNWVTGAIPKAPVVFEMRLKGAYETTLQTFSAYKNENVFDIHSHTYYSNCGRDNPEDVIKTAIQNGIRTFGICDHNYGIGNRKQEYILNMRELAKKHEKDIKLLCGIEIATYPELFDIEDPKEIEACDYCLIEHITDERSLVKGDLIPFCKNLNLLCGIAHTDLFAYCDMYGYDYKKFFP